jgi:porphobilinogen deaminase
VPEGDALVLHACIADLSGRTVLRASCPVNADEPAESGTALAQELLAAGASEILDQLRATGGGRA